MGWFDARPSLASRSLLAGSMGLCKSTALLNVPAKYLVSALLVNDVTPPCLELTSVKKQHDGRALGLTTTRAARSFCWISRTLSSNGSKGICSTYQTQAHTHTQWQGLGSKKVCVNPLCGVL